MNTMLRSLASVAALTAACIIEPVPATNWGTLEVEWTIHGNIDPNLCYLSSATTLAVDVYDSNGGLAGYYDAPCTAFATSIDLYWGTYSANARLLDAAGRTRSTTVGIAPFRIRGGSTLVIPIDFPPSSFY